MSACRWGVELWDCLDQAVSEVAIHNNFLTNNCSKYIRSDIKWIRSGIIMQTIQREGRS